MSDWISMERWPDCRQLERPGIVFELRNREGLVLTTPCTEGSPAVPFDWRSPPAEFRAVAEAPPLRSAPMPKAVDPG